MKPRNFIFLLIFVILIAALAVAKHLTADRVENIETGYLGNTAGNLNNGGYFCEENGKVYFSNFYDNGTLYSMNSDESDIKKLSNQSVKFINAAGSHLYYYMSDNTNGSDLGSVLRSSGIYRCTTDGQNIKCLKKCVSDSLLLNGNRIYYQYYDSASGFSLYRMSTKGEDDTQVTDYIVNPACGDQNNIYFHGTQNDHNLYRLDTETDTVTRIWDGSLWNPVYSQGYIYYMDLSDHYRICRLDMTTGEVSIVTSKRVDFFNVSNDYVFFQTGGDEEAALIRVNKDGSGETVLAYGVYSNLSLTDNYLYFTAYGSNTMYHCPVNSDYPEEFTAAFDSAAANMK